MENVSEHRVDMPVAPAACKAAAALPEKGLSRFVHFVATLERVGNALGTLAFTWATVVLLGGYATELGPDFYVATAVIFLEAMRMFSRNNRLDYQLFFRTRGAFRSLGWNALLLLICFYNVLVCIAFIWGNYDIVSIMALSMIYLVIGIIICPEDAIPAMCNQLPRIISLWSPMVAILLLCPSVLYRIDSNSTYRLSFRNAIANLTVYLVLFVVVLLLTVSRLQFPIIVKLVDSALGNKVAFWHRVILNLSMFAAIVMSLCTFGGDYKVIRIAFDICIPMIASFGNLQFPAAVLRTGVALWGLRITPWIFIVYDKQVDKTDLGDQKNLVPSLNIFYGMLLGQGLLYIVASILAVFSFILRRSLIRRAGFRGTAGVKYVNLYYAYAFEKCMEGAVLGPEKTNLVIFATDYLKSGSPKKQLYGLKMLHMFLRKEPLKTKAISELTTSTKKMTRLVSMLGWTSERDKYIRSFAAKVIAEIADNIRVVSVPGAMQLIASLLDTVHARKIKDPLLDIGSPEPIQDNLIQRVDGNEHASPMFKWLKEMATYCLVPREEPTNMDEQTPRILRCWMWSVPEEESWTDMDPLPILGMLILDKLARFDLESCMEISRATGLLYNIIEFTSNQTDMANISEMHQKILKHSSLKLLRKLSSTRGKFGVTLRQKISEHPFLLSHLAEILDDSGSSQELRELTTELLRNLAMEKNIKEEIGHIPVIISRLMHAFLSQGAVSATDSDQSLRLISGQALAVLAMESANNCSVMLAEPGYEIVKVLTVMIHGQRYRYIASSLLQNMCVHARPELGTSDLKEISYISREVLERIMDAEGAELEVLVGLSSQICNVIPDDFARELQHGQIQGRFIRRLVNVLNSNRTPSAHCPGIRRVVVEHAIYMMEFNPGYAHLFIECQMMEALRETERKPSRAENYKFFLGDAGLLEHRIPMSAVVSRAKELMGRE